ncbi:MAG: AraC family transcriptional regulator [Candidatus Azobacteroides sp.]|nr:AraC family transcriptional regulator [Candidatus Azobacteroides sp.]
MHYAEFKNKNKNNLKYSPTLAGKESFFFDHVHTKWDHQISLHQQETWELSYVITGKGVRVIGDMMEPFAQGEVIIIPPHIPHCWSFDENAYDKEGKIENITISFSNKLLDGISTLFPEFSESVIRIKNNENAVSFSGETLLKLQQRMVSMSSETHPERISSFLQLLHTIAFPETIHIVGHPVTEDRNIQKMQQIYLYVMNNFQHTITLSEIARFIGMEKSAFCVFFKKMTQTSFFTFLLEYRINSSCQMLVQTEKSVSEICLASGFRDVPYYNRVFKKIKQMSPGQYRKLYANGLS